MLMSSFFYMRWILKLNNDREDNPKVNIYWASILSQTETRASHAYQPLSTTVYLIIWVYSAEQGPTLLPWMEPLHIYKYRGLRRHSIYSYEEDECGLDFSITMVGEGGISLDVEKLNKVLRSQGFRPMVNHGLKCRPVRKTDYRKC